MNQRPAKSSRQPSPGLVGMRVGAVSGTLIGGGLAVLTGLFWLIVAGAVLGGAAGWLGERTGGTRRGDSDGAE